MLQKILNRGRQYSIVNFDDWIQLVNQNRKVVILATKYVMFIADLLKYSFELLGIKVEIIKRKPLFGFSDLPHIIIAPQAFKELPRNYVGYQVEQLEASKWFTDEYINKLSNAVAIFDYSKKNLEVLRERRLNANIFYVPITIQLELLNKFKTPANKKKYDVLFYGSMGFKRRQEIIGLLSEKYNIKVIKNLYGEALYKELAQAKIIVNIHAYENALLETTRIYELLSLNNSVIISEKAADQNEHYSLEELVDFVDIGDISTLMTKIDYYLSSTDLVKNKLDFNKQIIRSMNINDFSETLKTIIRM